MHRDTRALFNASQVYKRSAAGNTEQMDAPNVRHPRALVETVDYLINEILDADKAGEAEKMATGVEAEVNAARGANACGVAVVVRTCRGT